MSSDKIQILTPSEEHEFDNLCAILDNVGADVVYRSLYDRWFDLCIKADKGMGTGAFYCPYIPISFTITAVDPNTFEVVFTR